MYADWIVMKKSPQAGTLYIVRLQSSVYDVRGMLFLSRAILNMIDPAASVR